MSSTTPVHMTDAETCLWNCLCSSRLGPDAFYTKHVVGGYTVDFCSPRWKLIVEIDDPQYVEHDEFYVIRNAWFAADGWRLLRFTDHDALKNTEGVVSVILASVGKRDPNVPRTAVRPIGGVLDFEI